ncbi:flagellar basal body rod protein FlgC [Paracidobacterium acidisoli]|uniref:Flagellar basal-body rod protein FlgC n=1 Tax=Paracidobacterium acidisoli TaxID=2303751 RepID=A0A372IR40_9BACT|nr:flagellar basal body rod protein FlgC [Paracidobacterium acidisoli]MBT9330287.1 flagellar basal body rod protein FlgC [Paracidobacterium acidisoli]
MNLFGVMEVSGSALKAERIRAEVVAANMANAETTRTPEGGPYRRHHVVFTAAPGTQSAFGNVLLGETGVLGGTSTTAFPVGAPIGAEAEDEAQIGGVEVSAVVEDKASVLKRYDPQHPDADANGFVSYPDINPVTEMVDLMGAERAYGLNSSAVQATKGMISSSIDILK